MFILFYSVMFEGHPVWLSGYAHASTNAAVLLQLSLDLHYTEDEIYELSLAREPRNSLSSVSSHTLLPVNYTPIIGYQQSASRSIVTIVPFYNRFSAVRSICYCSRSFSPDCFAPTDRSHRFVACCAQAGAQIIWVGWVMTSLKICSAQVV